MTDQKKKKIWNPFQQAVFKDFASGMGHTAVDAVAGSGKSTVAIECLNHLPKGNFSVLLTSFSVQSVNDLKAKEPPWFVECRTLNSLGNQALSRAKGPQKVSKLRAFGIIDQVLGFNRGMIQDSERKSQFNSFRQRVKALVDFAKASLVDGIKPLNALAEHHELDLAVPEWLGKELKEHFKCEHVDAIAAVTSKVLEASKNIDGTVDFNDQLWLPIVLNFEPQKFDYILVDEAQDLSAVQIELLCRSMKPTSRVFMWGQNFQAIYAWRGAGLGMEPFIERLKAKVLPLSISYRCPQLVTKHAQKLCPEMKAAPEAPMGVVEDIEKGELARTVQMGDVILSRKNAPLVGLFMRFLKAGVPAGIQGKDLGGRLISFVEDSACKTVDELLDYTREWAKRECAKRRKKNPEAKLDAIHDHADCIQTLCEDTTHIDVVIERIKTLLMSDPAGKVCLSSVHRAKGLEWNRVFLIESSFPVCADYWIGFSKYDDTDGWAAKKAAEVMKTDTEERNIRYVALTRAREAMYFVREDGVKALEEDE
jgi:DNA helicase II / ATP-dependent DNA helicase PcrA